MAVHDVEGVVNVERHRGGRTAIARTIDVDHRVGHAHHLAQGRRVLPARDGRLRAEIIAAVRQPPAGKLEGGIAAQAIEVIGVLVAAGDRQHAGTQNVGDTVGDQRRVTRIGDQRCQTFGNPDPPLGRRQKHDAAIGRQAPAIEGGGEFLAADSWKGERLKGSIAHGGCGSACSRGPDGFDTQSLSTINALRHISQQIIAMP